MFGIIITNSINDNDTITAPAAVSSTSDSCENIRKLPEVAIGDYGHGNFLYAPAAVSSTRDSGRLHRESGGVLN